MKELRGLVGPESKHLLVHSFIRFSIIYCLFIHQIL